jgi:hypothetical protein
VVLTIFIGIIGWPLEMLRMVPLAMFLGTFLVALSYMIHARIEAKFDTIPARLLVAFLAFMQPLGRGWARYFTWMKYKGTPSAVIAKPEAELQPEAHKGGVTKLNFWSEAGGGREQLLTEVFALLEAEDWRYSTDTGWKDWDVQIYGNQFWSIQMKSVTEYHGGPKCLTRVQLTYHAVALTWLLNGLALLVLLYRLAFTAYRDHLWWGIYALLVGWLYLRGWRLKRRVADLIIHAAQRCGLMRVSGAASRRAPGGES